VRPDGRVLRPAPDLVPKQRVDAAVPRPPAPRIPVALGTSEAHAVVRANQKDLEACYRQAVERRKLRGPVSVILVVIVDTHGDSKLVSVFPEGPVRTSLGSCFNNKILRWRFPRATRFYQVRAALDFKPD
jgi:hypothetical protein